MDIADAQNSTHAQPNAFVSAGWMGFPSSSASIADFRSGEESFDATRPW